MVQNRFGVPFWESCTHFRAGIFVVGLVDVGGNLGLVPRPSNDWNPSQPILRFQKGLDLYLFSGG